MSTSLLSQIRPRVHYARVPKGVGSADICKELVKRFTPSELTCVQDYGLGKFEVSVPRCSGQGGAHHWLPGGRG
ncbi:hypothetical protein MRX96_023004 [Rhipicephalus microplus]